MRTIITLIILAMATGTHAQYTNKKKNPFHQQYHDSLVNMNYPYTFPILARKAYKKGYDIPYPWGISPAYFAIRQEIKITKTAIGFNDLAPVDLTQYIQFGKITSSGNVFTIRPDLWVLPFLNIYGVFGTGSGNTEVPLTEPFVFTTNQASTEKNIGFGFTVAGGLEGVLLIIDNNFNLATTEKLSEPVPAYNFDARIGHNFSSGRYADRSLTVWAGAFYQKIKADTRGSIAIKDVFPGLSPQQQQKIRNRLDEWLNTLPPAQQIVAGEMIRKIHDYFDGTDAGDGKITYELDKKIAGPWNLVFGSQYQHNKHWMLRMELGTFGKRTQFLLMLNYRWQGLKKKNGNQ